MGLFSLFKKGKDAVEDDDAAVRLAANSELERQNAQTQLQRDIARATAMKIDAIESAMEFDIFNTPEPAWGSRPAARPPRPQTQDDNPDTLPLLDAHTTELLGDDDMPAPAASAQAAPVVEEIAILYANGQSGVAGQMLAATLAETAGAGSQQDRGVWWMLFDLYQVSGQQEQFDNLSIDYASTFETSPPAWRGPAPQAEAAAPAYSGVTPTVAFGALLDAGIAPQLERVNALAATAPLLRLDFSRVTALDAPGCALLLAALQAVQKSRRELIVVAAPELADLLRSTLCVGRRDDGEAPWLLLLELLQLLNREKDFEEIGMDYCVTFEVSPPSFVAPHKVATAARQHVAAAPDRFMLPPVIEGDIGALLGAICAYADQYPALVFDCSRLARIDFGAANQLLTRLQALARQEQETPRKVELRDVNHLVAALLRLLGYGTVARIYAHKY
ncbi:MAG: STAS domain-containing protein [Pseudomonadota bacterium]